METCAYCKSQETELFENGVAVCIGCMNSREAKAKTREPSRNIRPYLIEALCKTSAEAHHADRELNQAIGELSGLHQPDGAERVNSASLKLSAARKNMWEAHNRLSEFFSRGIVPEDLKDRKG
jgi:hypothetical protein